MKVLLASKANLVGTYQTKLTALAAEPDLELGVLVPPYWDDPAGRIEFEPAHTEGYTLWVDPIRFNGNYHLYHFQTLGQRLREFRPDILHIDEEPYNLATALAVWQARRLGIKTVCFAWQNILRTYPIPFSQLERWVLNRLDYAIWGNRAAGEVFHTKGYPGPSAVIPQFGVSTDLFTPPAQPRANDSVQIGFLGRLVEGKGIDHLIQAVAQLPSDLNWTLWIIGDGPKKAEWEALAKQTAVSDRIRFEQARPSAEVPGLMQALDILVLPSVTLPNWKEQFGRVLIEAMATECAVIGSNSGEIPQVVGDAGYIFPEGDVDALQTHLATLITRPETRADLGKAGRQRVLDRFTQDSIAAQTATVYRHTLAP